MSENTGKICRHGLLKRSCGQCEAEEEVAGCRDLIATQRTRIAEAEQYFAMRVKEYREKIEQLETDKANYHDKWLIALYKLDAAAKWAEDAEAKLRELEADKYYGLAQKWMDDCHAAEQENAQLREALHLWRKGDMPGHPFGTLAEARTLTAALLNQPK